MIAEKFLDTHATRLEEKNGFIFYGQEREENCVAIICFSKELNNTVYEVFLTPFNFDMARLGRKFLETLDKKNEKST